MGPSVRHLLPVAFRSRDHADRGSRAWMGFFRAFTIQPLRSASSMLVLALLPAAAVPVPVTLVAWQRAIAGMSAYCCATVVSSPVDVVKTRMQLKRADGGGTAGMTSQAITMLRNEGASVFFSGLGPALLMAPAAMVQYTLMDPLRGEPTPAQHCRPASVH